MKKAKCAKCGKEVDGAPAGRAVLCGDCGKNMSPWDIMEFLTKSEAAKAVR
jgi:NMD protein affecting ribosome stability and mRNA decay